MSYTSPRQARLLVLATLLATGLGLAAMPPASAQVLRESVQLSDLDLATPRGQRRLERRLEAAMERVCPAPRSVVPTSPRSRRQVRECRASARESVRAQLRGRGIPATVLAGRH